MMLRTSLLGFTGLTLLAMTAGGAAQATPLPAYSPAALTCGGYGHGGGKNVTINKPITVNKNITINKPITVNKTFNLSKNIVINKPITINKNIHIEKSFDLSKNINIEKNIDVSKHINIEKNIHIEKNVDIDVSAQAFAFASAQAAATTFVGGGGTHITVINQGGELGQLAVAAEAEVCVEQWATVVKSIHAVCVDKYGKDHPAVRMRKETWIDSPMDKELYRCLAGAHLVVTVGDVLQSNKGLAGTFENGKEIVCRHGEALRHYKDGVLKCDVAEKVPDCTERENMRKHGIGTYFFSYQTKVCVPGPFIAKSEKVYSAPRRPLPLPKEEVEVEMEDLKGGVGELDVLK